MSVHGFISELWRQAWPRSHTKSAGDQLSFDKIDSARLGSLAETMTMKIFVRGGIVLVAMAGTAAASDIPIKAPPPLEAYDWTGLYVGGHIGYAAGFSNWSATSTSVPAPPLTGSLDLFQGYNFRTGSGSYLLGLQGSYNYMLPSRVVLGAEADVSFPSVLGASQAIASPLSGQAIYRDKVEMSGTVRGRVGYALGQWLF
jgi:high affinity Mn2+ porin